MNADLVLDVDDPAAIRAAVEPSLRDGGRVSFQVAGDDTLDIGVRADTLGALRGGVNTAMMLTRVATTLNQR